jgi:hypothetical protein
VSLLSIKILLIFEETVMKSLYFSRLIAGRVPVNYNKLSWKNNYQKLIGGRGSVKKEERIYGKKGKTALGKPSNYRGIYSVGYICDSFLYYAQLRQ